MSTVNYEKMYVELYRLFDGITPIKKDCGELCGRACCRGDDRTGMLLFPYEKTVFKEISSGNARYAVCSGKCDREKRPLACRIFPFFPVIDERGKISVSVDPRAYNICPLALHSEKVVFDARFLKNVKKAGKILAMDRECKSFLREISSQIADINDLIGIIR